MSLIFKNNQFFVKFKVFIIQTSQRNVYFVIAKFLLGGCWGGGSHFYGMVYWTRGLLYVVHKNCNFANLDSYRLVVL